jgi:hypothetical protein
MSFKLALALLQTTLVCPTVNEVFQAKVGKVTSLADVPKGVELKSYLFVHDRLETGALFVDNMVNVANRLAEFLESSANFGPAKKPTSKKRIGALLFRTLCSDLVEIYVGHGCFPSCSTDCRERHPWLHALQEKMKKKHPVPLLLEFIILAIQNKAIQVAASHIYSRGNKLLHNKVINGEAEQTNTTLTTTTPREQKDIRYWFKIININISKEGSGSDDDSVEGSKEGEEEEEEEEEEKTNENEEEEEEDKPEATVEDTGQWLSLPELVNVTLFGRTSPCVDDDSIDKQIKWSTDEIMPTSSKKITLWESPDLKKKKAKEEPTKEAIKGEAKDEAKGARKKRKKDEGVDDTGTESPAEAGVATVDGDMALLQSELEETKADLEQTKVDLEEALADQQALQDSLDEMKNYKAKFLSLKNTLNKTVKEATRDLKMKVTELNDQLKTQEEEYKMKVT